MELTDGTRTKVDGRRTTEAVGGRAPDESLELRMSGIKVVVSHPGKQGNVYQRPRAAEWAGCDVTFLTGLYYFPERIP